jgi:uncharacterized protein YoxC
MDKDKRRDELVQELCDFCNNHPLNDGHKHQEVNESNVEILRAFADFILSREQSLADRIMGKCQEVNKLMDENNSLSQEIIKLDDKIKALEAKIEEMVKVLKDASLDYPEAIDNALRIGEK